MRGWHAAVVASAAAAVVAGSLFPITSWDVFWHLRIGQDIVETGRLPEADIYSFSRPGGMYVEDEWAFQAGAHLLHRLTGWTGISVAKVLLMLVAAGLLFVECRASSGSTAIAAGTVALSTLGARTRLLARPDVVNLLFFPALLTIVFAYRRTGRIRLLWLLPPLFGVWANCHSGVTLGLFVLAAVAGADLLASGLPSLLKSPRPPGPLLVALAASFGATLINPIGFRIILFPFEVVGVHRTIEWQHTPLLAFPLFTLLGVAFLVLTVTNIRHLDLAELGSVAMLLALGIRHVRMMGIFAMVACLPLARGLGLFLGRLPIPRSAQARERWRSRLLAVESGGLLLLCCFYLFVNDYHGLGLGLARDHYPEGAADFILAERPPRQMWNEFTFGGYLMYRLYPEYRIFIDNREEPYYTLLDEIRDALASPAAFQQHLDRYSINFAVLRYTRQPFLTRAPDGTPIPRGWPLFFPPADWPLVYWDDVAMIHVRREAADPDWLAQHEVRGYHPDEWGQAEARARLDPELRGELIRAMRAKLTEDPDCDRARWMLGRLRPDERFGP